MHQTPPPSCSYQVAAHAAWTDVGPVVADGAALVQDGVCARCEHPMRYRSNVVLTASGAVAPPALDDIEIVIECDCGQVHDGRPADERGCGAFWYWPEPSSPT